MNQTLVGALFLTIASSIWSGMYVVVKIIVDIVPPIELILLRYVIALLIIGLYMKQSFRIQKRDCGIIFLFPTSCQHSSEDYCLGNSSVSLFGLVLKK